MFAYCNNNPANMSDAEGSRPAWEGPHGEYTDTGTGGRATYTTKYAQVSVTPRTITIDAYFEFSDQSYSDVLTNGIKQNWEGDYIINGAKKQVIVNIHNGSSPMGEAINVSIINASGRSYASGHFADITPTVYLYLKINDHDERIDWVIAHEFGHCLGVGDYYIDGVVLEYFESIMHHRYMHASSADIEMVLKAFSTGEYCTWR